MNKCISSFFTSSPWNTINILSDVDHKHLVILPTNVILLATSSLRALKRVNLYTCASLNVQNSLQSNIVYGPCSVKEAIVSVVWFLIFCMLVLSGSFIWARSLDYLLHIIDSSAFFKKRGSWKMQPWLNFIYFLRLIILVLQ